MFRRDFLRGAFVTRPSEITDACSSTIGPANDPPKIDTLGSRPPDGCVSIVCLSTVGRPEILLRKVLKQGP